MSTYLSRNQTSLTRTLETHSLAPSFRKLYSGFAPRPHSSPNHHHGSQDFAGARGPVTSPSFLDHFFQPSVLCPNSSEPTPGPVSIFPRPFSQGGSHDVCTPRPAGWLGGSNLERCVEQAYTWTGMFLFVFTGSHV